MNPSDSVQKSTGSDACGLRVSWTAILAHLSVGIAVMLPASFVVLWHQHRPTVVSDCTRHVDIAIRGIEKDDWPEYPLFHLTIAAATGWYSDKRALLTASLGILMIMVSAKFVATFYLIERRVATVMAMNHACTAIAATAVSVVTAMSLLVQFVTPIMWRSPPVMIQLGGINPTIWSSPTYIFAIPVAFLCFDAGSRALKEDQSGSYLAVAVLTALSAVSKPTYLLAFVPAYCGAALVFGKASRVKFVKALLSLSPAALILVSQYVSLSGRLDGTLSEPAWSMTFAPLAGVLVYNDIPHFAVGLAASFAFPIAYAVLFRKQLVHKVDLAIAWLSVIVGLLWCMLFVEIYPTGEVSRNGNIFGVATAANAVLFVVTMADFLSNSIPRKGETRARWPSMQIVAVLCLLALHYASGLVYFCSHLTGRVAF